jgi:hypothetical protein
MSYREVACTNTAGIVRELPYRLNRPGEQPFLTHHGPHSSRIFRSRRWSKLRRASFATRMPALAVDIRSFFHCFALWAAILLTGLHLAATVQVCTFLVCCRVHMFFLFKLPDLCGVPIMRIIKQVPGQPDLAYSLIRGRGFLIFYLKLVHHLLDIRYLTGHLFDIGTFRLRVYFTG